MKNLVVVRPLCELQGSGRMENILAGILGKLENEGVAIESIVRASELESTDMRNRHVLFAVFIVVIPLGAALTELVHDLIACLSIEVVIDTVYFRSSGCQCPRLQDISALGGIFPMRGRICRSVRTELEKLLADQCFRIMNEHAF